MNMVEISLPLRRFLERAELIQMNITDSVVTGSKVLAHTLDMESEDNGELFWVWKRYVTLRRYGCLISLINEFSAYVMDMCDIAVTDISNSKYKQGIVVIIRELLGSLDEFSEEEISTLKRWIEHRNVITHTAGRLDEKAVKKLSELGHSEIDRGLQYLPMSTDFAYAKDFLISIAKKMDNLAIQKYGIEAEIHDIKKLKNLISRLESITL